MAQGVTPRRLGSTYHTANDTSVITDIRERLVQLALQNPNFEIALKCLINKSAELKSEALY